MTARTDRSTTIALPRCLLRSTGAVLFGFIAVVVLSLATDQMLHMPMYATGLNLLALSYRIVYAVAGSYIAARLAPRNPMRHAMALGVVGFVLSTAAAIATIPMDLGPSWFPIALVLTALPCAWLGGAVHRTGQAG